VVRIRYRNIETGLVEEIATDLRAADVLPAGRPTPPRFRLAASAAQFAEILRESPYAKDASLKDVETALSDVCAELPLDNRAAELLDLVQAAESLPRGN